MCDITSLIFIDRYDDVIEVLKGGAASQQSTPITRESSPKEITDAVIAKYVEEAKILYQCGHKTFMTRLMHGDGETYYLHTARWYIPKLMRITYNLQGLGIGIFTMEAFEYKNFTSKLVVLHRTNKRGNVPKQSLKVLQLMYRPST